MQGPVSLMAHSLGSVLSYDILCNQPLHSRRAADPLLHTMPTPSIWSSPSQSQTSHRSNPHASVTDSELAPIQSSDLDLPTSSNQATPWTVQARPIPGTPQPAASSKSQASSMESATSHPFQDSRPSSSGTTYSPAPTAATSPRSAPSGNLTTAGASPVAAGVSPSAAAVPALSSGAWDALGTGHSQGRTVGTNSLAAGIGGWDSSAWGLTEPAAEASALASGALPQLNFDVDQLICAGGTRCGLQLNVQMSSLQSLFCCSIPLCSPGGGQIMPAAVDSIYNVIGSSFSCTVCQLKQLDVKHQMSILIHSGRAAAPARSSLLNFGSANIKLQRVACSPAINRLCRPIDGCRPA